MDTKKIILGVAVIFVLVALLSVYSGKNWEKRISEKNTNEISATVTLPNGTVQKITGTSGFPAGGGSPSDKPPSPPG